MNCLYKLTDMVYVIPLPLKTLSWCIHMHNLRAILAGDYLMCKKQIYDYQYKGGTSGSVSSKSSTFSDEGV